MLSIEWQATNSVQIMYCFSHIRKLAEVRSSPLLKQSLLMGKAVGKHLYDKIDEI